MTGAHHESATVRITCATENCGTFPMDRALHKKLQRSGATFTCPAGHEQHFTESPEKRLKEKIQNLKSKIERLERLKERNDKAVRDSWEDYKREKNRRRFAESRLLDYAKGVVEVADEQYRWSCECDARGQKSFDDPDDCRSALKRHRRRSCPIDEKVEVSVDAQ